MKKQQLEKLICGCKSCPFVCSDPKRDYKSICVITDKELPFNYCKELATERMNFCPLPISINFEKIEYKFQPHIYSYKRK